MISAPIRQQGVTGLCEGNSPVTGEFPAPQRDSYAENVSIDDVIMKFPAQWAIDVEKLLCRDIFMTIFRHQSST